MQAVLNNIALGLVDDHACHCMQGTGDGPEDPQEEVGELNEFAVPRSPLRQALRKRWLALPSHLLRN